MNELRVQFCGITDFRPINQMPALTQLAAFGQNTGRNDPTTDINAKDLNYDADKQTIDIPFSIMPNRMTNYAGYVPHSLRQIVLIRPTLISMVYS